MAITKSTGIMMKKRKSKKVSEAYKSGGRHVYLTAKSQRMADYIVDKYGYQSRSMVINDGIPLLYDKLVGVK